MADLGWDGQESRNSNVFRLKITFLLLFCVKITFVKGEFHPNTDPLQTGIEIRRKLCFIAPNRQTG